MKKCTPFWREAHFEVKMYKAPQPRTAFGSCDVEKVHAVVARSTFPSQNVQNTPWSDHFWKLRCRKSARRCGAKHISKSKCAKHTMVGPLLEVQMSKKCTPLWREAHFEVKMLKTLGVQTTFEVQMSKKCTLLWREAHFEVKMLKTPGVRTTFGGSDVASRGKRKEFCTLSKVTKNVRVLKRFQRQPPLHHTTLQYITLHYNYNYNYILLHYTPLHSTTLRYTKLHYVTLHYTPLHYTTLQYTTLHDLPLHFTTLHYTTFHYTTTLHYIPLHSTTLQYTTLHYTE